ncbi:hypothetical protein BYT27DRAFT_7263750 [Phlegmacium glaucopus]|nr:hypothetical protein BYT27DRAFT_7263750 [Phlegmacium glaucopus]
MPYLPGIQHPHFLHLSHTEYAINSPDLRCCWYVHAGQIMNYLAFNKVLCDGDNLDNFPGIPMGYINFVTAFNTGTYPHAKHHISSFIPSSTGDHIIKSDDPVVLEDFYITPEQCGLAPPHCNNLTEEQAFVFEDYATSQAFKNQKKHEHFQQREDRHHNLFGRCCAPILIGSMRRKLKSRHHENKRTLNLLTYFGSGPESRSWSTKPFVQR